MAAMFWDLPLEAGGTVPADRSRFLRLHAVPDRFAGQPLHGTAVIIHGGYWQNRFGLDDEYGNAGTISLAPYFLARGFAAVELEYRRQDHEGGGWPGTNEDILAALARIAALTQEASPTAEAPGEEAAGSDSVRENDAKRRLRPDRIVLVGHSAGGCLALWTAHQQLPAGIKVALVMAMAPVGDLVEGYKRKISDSGVAVEKYMKCNPDSEEALAQYAKASPQALLPITFPVIIAFGSKDTDVPPDYMEQYAKEAKSGAPELVTWLCVPDVDHFDMVNTAHAAWLEAVVPEAATILKSHVGDDVAAAFAAQC